MSGGHFDYKQYQIADIVDEVENVLASDDEYHRHLSAETRAAFAEAVHLLRRAQIYAQRIDWLLSGDDGEETFHRRLAEELTGESDR